MGHTEAGRQRLAEAAHNRVWSEESRKKLGDSHRGKKNPHEGRPWTEEQKEALRLKMIQDRRVDPVQWFFDHVTPTEDGCLLWNAGKIGKNQQYGVMRDGHGRKVPAYRWAYERFVGPIPEGYELDHLGHCTSTLCVSYDTCFEPVTPAENRRRQHERGKALDPEAYSVWQGSKTLGKHWTWHKNGGTNEG